MKIEMINDDKFKVTYEITKEEIFEMKDYRNCVTNDVTNRVVNILTQKISDNIYDDVVSRLNMDSILKSVTLGVVNDIRNNVNR